MKTENNLSNKAAFMTQYWGQRVLIRNINHEQYDDIIVCNEYRWDGWGTCILQLTPIDHITDEHIQVCVDLFNNYSNENDLGGGHGTIEEVKRHGNIEMATVFTPAADYLRSKGYAVSWRELSVCDLVSYGWVKLKEVENE